MAFFGSLQKHSRGTRDHSPLNIIVAILKRHLVRRIHSGKRSGMSCSFTNIHKTLYTTQIQLEAKPLRIDVGYENSKDMGRLYKGEYPSVTTILSNTVSGINRYILQKWKDKWIRDYGSDNFESMMEETLDQGSEFHGCVAEWLLRFERARITYSSTSFSNEENPECTVSSNADSGQYPDNDIHKQILRDLVNSCSVNTVNRLKSVCHVINHISQVIAVESCVIHPILRYGGTLDCIGIYKGTVYLIDWKTSRKKKRTFKDLYDYPLQVVAYIGALNFDPSYPFKVENAAIVIAYENGDPADVHLLSYEQCNKLWEVWLQRLRKFEKEGS